MGELRHCEFKSFFFATVSIHVFKRAKVNLQITFSISKHTVVVSSAVTFPISKRRHESDIKTCEASKSLLLIKVNISVSLHYREDTLSLSLSLIPNCPMKHFDLFRTRTQNRYMLIFCGSTYPENVTCQNCFLISQIISS